jgi:uncharacterized protein with HEPN domain
MTLDLPGVLERLRAHEGDLRRLGVVHAGVFGSVARGDARMDSDVDVLVEPDADRPIGIFEYARLKLCCRLASCATRFTPSENPAQRLADILENTDAIQSFTANLDFDAFRADRKTVYAVVRALEIISEASRRLPAELLRRHPEIDWIAVAAAGNVYRHGVAHGAGYLAVTALVAWVVFEWLGVGLLRKAWVNLDLIWAFALIASGVLTLTI